MIYTGFYIGKFIFHKENVNYSYVVTVYNQIGRFNLSSLIYKCEEARLTK